MALLAAILMASGGRVQGQDAVQSKQILDRLDRLEKQNAELIEEVRQLRLQLNGASKAVAPAGEKAATGETSVADSLAIEQARIDEQAQSKVEADHRLPIRITGMVLFNAFDFSHNSGISSGIATLSPYGAAINASLNQSIFGLEYQDPYAILGGHVHGALYMDLAGTNNAGYALPRLRTGTITLDWQSRSITAGVDKPLIAPLQPDSLAQVAVPPLTGAGNLWLWQPQVRFEQRVRTSDDDTLRFQAALYGTRETYGYVPGEYAGSVEPTRPGWEGRFAYEHRSGDETRLEIAPGFHFSTTHVDGQSVNSRIASVDGQFRMVHWWDLSGTFFGGQNLAGVGGVGDGFVIGPDDIARAVHSTGGWLQLTLSPATRLSFHLFGGEQSNRRADLPYGAIGSNAAYAANVYYQLAPNVFAAFEAGQVRTDWTQSGARLRNLYDLSLAYMF